LIEGSKKQGLLDVLHKQQSLPNATRIFFCLTDNLPEGHGLFFRLLVPTGKNT